MHDVIEISDVIKMFELLNFNKKNRDDILLLLEDFLSRTENYQIDDMLYKDGKISRNLSNHVIRLKQYNELSSDIKEYLKDFNIEQFVLRKVDYYGVINYDDITKLFCEVQQIELDRLKDEGCLNTEYTGDFPNDYREIRLSKKGLVKLFKINNAKEVERFVRELESLRYDTNLLDDFLKTCNLDYPVWSILNKENIDKYCNDYDRCAFIDGVERVDYIELDEDDKNKEYIENMLNISDARQSLYITHPNYIFSNPNLITDDVKEIENIDWDDIDIHKLFKIGCFKKISLNTWDETFKYISNNLLERKSKNPSYLTVLEKRFFEGTCEERYFVRGIVKLDEEKFSLAFNPKYKKYTAEKSDRDSKPKIYYKIG